MPTYDYVCDACGHSFELFQSITDAVKKKCPECSKSKLRRLFGTGAAVMFKGSGFYTTDYRSESYKKAAKADSTDSGKSDGSKADAKKSESKTQSQPAADAAKKSKPAKPG